MPITDIYERLPLASIFIQREARQRREIDVADLLESIRARGVFNAIIVERGGIDGRCRLIAGERRFVASQQLNLPDIPVRYIDQLTELEAQIVELEENLKRRDLVWQDQVRAVARIHTLYDERSENEWTTTDTAESLGLSQGHISLCMTVAGHLSDERVATSTTMREAHNLLQRRKQRGAAEALEELIGIGQDLLPGEAETEDGDEDEAELAPADEIRAADGAGAMVRSPPRAASPGPQFTPPERCLLVESFLQWAPRYSGPKFNFIHCDFPYGIELFGGNGQFNEDAGTAYDDSQATYFTLLECLLTNLDKFASSSCHFMFWYSQKHDTRTRELFKTIQPGIELLPHPLIWVKSDNAGISPDVKRRPRHIYETALFGNRGGRNIVRIVADAVVAPTDKKSGPSVKPEPVLRHFFPMFVDDTSHVLDPTCGSAGAIRVAEELGAKRTLGMDTNEQLIGQDRAGLRQARALRLGASLL